MGRQPRATYRDHRHIGRGDTLGTGGDALHRQVIGTGRRPSGLHARATVPVVLCAITAVGCTDVVALAMTSRTSLRDVGLLSGPVPVAVHLLAVASLLVADMNDIFHVRQ